MASKKNAGWNDDDELDTSIPTPTTGYAGGIAAKYGDVTTPTTAAGFQMPIAPIKRKKFPNYAPMNRMKVGPPSPMRNPFYGD